MNTQENRYARVAARLLASESGTDEPRADSRRDAVVAAMALAIAAKARRRRMILVSGGIALAAAASVALLLTAGRERTRISPSLLTLADMTGTGTQLVRGGAAHTLVPGGSLFAGDVLRSGEGGLALLRTATGTQLTLSSSAELRVDQVSPSWRFSLSLGQLQAQVAKLGAAERFVVGLPDGEVEVRGTVFRVTVTKPAAGCGAAGTRSTVEVEEGTVAVREGGKEILLQKGQSWASACEAPTTVGSPSALPGLQTGESAPSVPPSKVAPRTPHTTGPRGPGVTTVVDTPDPARVPATVSHLAEQNDLFAAAMAAERQGQHDEALRRLDILLERFPDGPLTGSARAQKARILSARGGP